MNKTDSMGWSPKHFKDVHGGVLDAHTYNWMQKIKTGEYFLPFPVAVYHTLTLTANRILAFPFLVARDITIDRLAIEVTGAGAGDDVARLGIYKDGTNLYPGTLIVDAGTVLVDDTVVVAATISESLAKGLYFLVIASEGTATLRAFTPAWNPLGQSATAFGATNDKHYYKDAVGYAALADPFVTGASTLGAYMPSVLPRLLTLD